jgi:predicted GH43/DUF377 family glycosyl hydrolase
VVYSCGGLVHGGQLIIPYGVSDSATTFAAMQESYSCLELSTL